LAFRMDSTGMAWLPAALAILKDPIKPWEFRKEIFLLAALAGTTDPDFMTFTQNALKDEQARIRVAAARVLRWSGEKPETLLPVLKRVLEDEKAPLEVLKDAFLELDELNAGSEMLVPLLCLQLKGHLPTQADAPVPAGKYEWISNPIAEWAAQLLGEYEEEAVAAVPILMEAAKDPALRVKLAAKEAVLKISGGPQP